MSYTYNDGAGSNREFQDSESYISNSTKIIVAVILVLFVVGVVVLIIMLAMRKRFKKVLERQRASQLNRRRSYSTGDLVQSAMNRRSRRPNHTPRRRGIQAMTAHPSPNRTPPPAYNDLEGAPPPAYTHS